MHIDEGRLQALADGELPSDQKSQVERHLHDCLACRAELTELESAARTFRTAVGLLERPSAAGSGPPPTAATAPIGRSAPGWGALPRAAVFLLCLAGAAAAAVPGSPVRAWVERLAGSREPQVRTLPRAVVGTPSGGEVAEAGVSVDLHEGAVRVTLREAAPELVVQAVLTDGSRAGVLARGAAADARFRTAAGSIEVAGARGGELRIELPRSAREATVWVNGREHLRKESDQLRLAVPAAGRSATEVTFRIRP